MEPISKLTNEERDVKRNIVKKYLLEEQRIEKEITRQLKIKEELKLYIDKLLLEIGD